MPRFEVRLEAQDGSGHFRVTRLVASDKNAARKACERKELELVFYQLSEADQADIERRHKKALDKLPSAAVITADEAAKAAFRALPTADRARLHAHFQDEPYEVVSVDEVKE